MAEQAGAADGQAEEIVEQILRFAQRDAQMRAAISGQQPCAWPDVGAGQFQLAASLAGLLTAPAAINVAAIAMPFELGFGKVGDDVIVKVLGRFKIVAAAMGALLGMHLVFDEGRVRRRFGTKGAGMLAMFLASTVIGCALARGAALAGAFATLQELLYLVFQLRNPLAGYC